MNDIKMFSAYSLNYGIFAFKAESIKVAQTDKTHDWARNADRHFVSVCYGQNCVSTESASHLLAKGLT